MKLFLFVALFVCLHWPTVIKYVYSSSFCDTCTKVLLYLKHSFFYCIKIERNTWYLFTPLHLFDTFSNSLTAARIIMKNIINK